MIIILYDNFVQQNICDVGISEGQKREKYLKNNSQIWWKLLTYRFLKLNNTKHNKHEEEYKVRRNQVVTWVIKRKCYR